MICPGAIEREINTLMAIQNEMKDHLLEVYKGWEPVEVDDGYFDRLLQFLIAQKEKWEMVELITMKIKNMINN